MRRPQPLGRRDAPGPARGALPRAEPRGLAQGGLRLRRGREGGDLPPPEREDEGPHPAAPAAAQQGQRGGLRLGDGALHAAPGRGGRRLPADRDVGDAADRRGRRGEGRPLGRQGPRQGRRAAVELRAGYRHRLEGDRARRGLLGPLDRRRDPRVRPRRGPRAAGLGARRQGDLEGPEAARPRDPHAGGLAAEDPRQVRPDRRLVDLPDEGREDGRRPRLDRLRDRPRLRRRDDFVPRPAAAVQDPPARARDPRGRRARLVGRQGDPRAAATGRCRSSPARARCSSATRAGW